MTTQFKDTEARLWTVQITVGSVKRVKAALHIDLYRLIEDGCKPLSELMADPVQLVDVLYVLCQPEAEKRNVSDVQFGEAMAGDSIFAGSEAFLAAFKDFFPDPRVRAALATTLEKGRKVGDRLLKHAGRKLEEIDPEKEAERLIQEMERKYSGSGPGSVPASSALTPAR